MDLDLEELAAVIELLDKADFTDFRYEKGDLRIAVRRGGPPLDEQPGRSAPAPSVSLRDRPGAAAPPACSRGCRPPAKSWPRKGPSWCAPRCWAPSTARPSPATPPFVEIGDKVEPDSVVCIVEVMKLMNSMTAGVSGEVVAVHAENGDLVEFDQPLFSVRPIP